MGGCATKPKDLESEQAPAPIEAPAPADGAPPATDKHQTVAQENKDGDETTKEEPLIDVSEPAPKVEEGTTAEAKPAEAVEDVKEVAEAAAAPVDKKSDEPEVKA